MPAPRFSAIYQSDPVSYTAALGPESVTLTFDAAKMTGRWERQLRAAQREDKSEEVSDLILSVFIGWDVVDDQGQPVALTHDLLLDLPSKAMVALIEGMIKAAYPASEEGNGSSSTSSTASTDSSNSPASPQNGLATSPSPSTSTVPSPT
jgi:hypothetical protein